MFMKIIERYIFKRLIIILTSAAARASSSDDSGTGGCRRLLCLLFRTPVVTGVCKPPLPPPPPPEMSAVVIAAEVAEEEPPPPPLSLGLSSPPTGAPRRLDKIGVSSSAVEVVAEETAAPEPSTRTGVWPPPTSGFSLFFLVGDVREPKN